MVVYIFFLIAVQNKKWRDPLSNNAGFLILPHTLLDSLGNLLWTLLPQSLCSCAQGLSPKSWPSRVWNSRVFFCLVDVSFHHRKCLWLLILSCVAPSHHQSVTLSEMSERLHLFRQDGLPLSVTYHTLQWYWLLVSSDAVFNSFLRWRFFFFFFF